MVPDLYLRSQRAQLLLPPLARSHQDLQLAIDRRPVLTIGRVAGAQHIDEPLQELVFR